ncbi:hypothetical protein [uncultured Thiodictyon sp.]|uniref:hypothetical protein n=1 Tax=uncultured Thiodictyon sp. TaxID=1846217 RepID=UPI0025E23819|nr:hypothetical protein [uncultured Thiodictyon sp.]
MSTAPVAPGSAIDLLTSGVRPAVAYVDPENAQNVYIRGVLPEWMKQKMQEQGYDSAKKDDREAFKANYLIETRNHPQARTLDISDTPADTTDLILATQTQVDLEALNHAALAPDTPGTALTPATVDGDWIARETSIQLLESEALGARDVYVRSTIELGRVLLEHRDLCRDNGERTQALWDRLGITPASAYRLIRVAGAVKAMPSLRDLAERQYSHAIALIEGSDDDLLRQIASGEQTELPLDDISQMSVRTLRTRLRTLTEDVAGEVKRETKVLTKERDALVGEVEHLKALVDPTWQGLATATKRLRAAQQALADESRAVLTVLEHITGDDPATRLALEQAISGGARLFEALWNQYQDRAQADWADTTGE